MASVTFPVSIGGDGSTVTDDSNPSTGLAAGGHRVRFVPALAQLVAVASFTVAAAQAASSAVYTPVRGVTTTNDSLSGVAVRDGLTPVAGQRWLVTGQTTAAANGIYVVAAGAWTRATDANTSAQFVGMKLVGVQEGSFAGTYWYLSNIGTITLGTTNLTYDKLPARAQNTIWTVAQTFNGGATFGAALTMSGGPINEGAGASVASAATLVLNGTTGNYVDVTGTTAITAITLAAGSERVLRFTGVLQFGSAANLIVPSPDGTSNFITTAAGDYAVVRGYAGGVVHCTSYFRRAALDLSMAGGNMFGNLGFTNANINESLSSSVASASSVNLNNTTGNFVHITGLNTIGTIVLAAGSRRSVIFDSVCTLTASANLVLPSIGDITTVAGDSAEFVGDAAGVVRCVRFTRGDGRQISQLATQDSTAGTFIDFTGIPVWALRISIAFTNTSLSGTGIPLVQSRNISGPETSGYVGGCSIIDTSIANSAYSTGFAFGDASVATGSYNGIMTILKNAIGGIGSSNTISESHVIHNGTFTCVGGGQKSLSGTMTGIRITSSNGTDTFDNGFICVTFE